MEREGGKLPVVCVVVWLGGDFLLTEIKCFNVAAEGAARVTVMLQGAKVTKPRINSKHGRLPTSRPELLKNCREAAAGELSE